MMVARPWTAEEDAILRGHYPAGGADACLSRLPGRGRNPIQHRATVLGLTRGRESSGEPWKRQEDDVIRRYYPSDGSDIEDLLPGRTRKAIRERARRLGVAYSGPPRGLLQYA